MSLNTAMVVMPVLGSAKRDVARQLSSAAMYSDAKQADFCVYLSAILLGGLAINLWLGWWWADPVAALVMVPLIATEGIGTLHPECCERKGFLWDLAAAYAPGARGDTLPEPALLNSPYCKTASDPDSIVVKSK